MNATVLLLALGIQKSKHGGIICAGGQTFPTSKEIVQPTDPELDYAPGVVGVWIRLADAMFLQERFKSPLSEHPVWALLHPNVVERVSTSRLASLH